MAKLLGKGFREEGYAVDVVDTGGDALAAATACEYDALLLDVALPDLDGFEVCARLRRSGRQVPVLMLTGRDTVRDRIKGLDVGADDYVGKPFSFAELCARVRALIRRGGARDDVAAMLEAGPLRLDPLCRRVWADAAEIDLSTTEFVLLELLMRNPGRVLSRSRILDHVWGFRYPVRSNVVDQYVRYLRHKVGERPDRDRAGRRLPVSGPGVVNWPIRLRLTVDMGADVHGRRRRSAPCCSGAASRVGWRTTVTSTCGRAPSGWSRRPGATAPTACTPGRRPGPTPSSN